ncbi:hypothetical protein [Halalkalicoccus sp. NIPERK01]|uniref:DUF7093 family protein n=1 Tax=Halalkalicoccus sp. NIPERK01 TaxID=3053469 RepID=UPI00256EE215|nr:hypothetical protein [Halalkalicoccus sp. NIPERK01]MDL5361810.1 hypothetical protein [Halalkalicoccus sp. NIPERK01]
MSLRCSLLGHEYGESEIERDREERGNEVVISVVELERCTRCGKARTISENTEVTQRSQPRPRTAQPGPARPRPESESREADADPAGPGIEPRPEAGPEPGSDAGPRGDEREPTVEADPATEDTEIIEDGIEGEEREPGAWPEVDDHDRGAGGSSGWPSVEGEDEGFDATAPGGKTDLDFGGGLTPQADQGAEIIDSSEGSDAGGGSEPTFVSAGPTPAPDRSAGAGGETVLYCPNCEASGLDERDSLRAGDICPECHRGYLAEREP